MSTTTTTTTFPVARKALAGTCLLAIAFCTAAPLMTPLASRVDAAAATQQPYPACMVTPRMLIVVRIQSPRLPGPGWHAAMDSYPLAWLRLHDQEQQETGCAGAVQYVARVTRPIAPPPPPRKKPYHAPVSRWSTALRGVPGGDECAGVSRSAAFVHGVGSWVVPAGCFGGVWSINPANYSIGSAGGFGWCNWWPEALWRTLAILSAPRHSYARTGAAMWFAPGEQGAGSAGHWAYVEDIGPVVNGRQWLLISEMNDYWRGAGFGKVNFRFVYVDGGATSFLWW